MKVLYTERQNMARIWHYLVIGGVVVFNLVIWITSYGGREGLVDRNAITGLIVTALVPIAILLLFRVARLETKITDEGVYYRYFPFIPRQRHIPVSKILSWEVRKYRALVEFGGWGIRRRRFGRKRAFTAFGNQGFELFLDDGKEILFGTQNPGRVREALNKLMPKEKKREQEYHG
ncbi:MAG: hypothetical protein Kow00127_07900 [Bacteroidales bacterium]